MSNMSAEIGLVEGDSGGEAGSSVSERGDIGEQAYLVAAL